ncbi:MAG: TRAP transporter substrate-binding protein [Clostridiales Family XIII bacterium]|nr:TRAP transporter substrate-binding protein [Clostridiales Family XIII bacterium]
MDIRKKFRMVIAWAFVLAAATFVFTGCNGGSNSGSNAPENADASGGEETQASVPDENFTFQLAYATTTESVTGQSYELFADKLEEYSGGTITVNTFPSQSLVSDAEVIDAISNGTVTFAHAVSSYIDPTVKEITPLEIPGAYNGDRYLDEARVLKPILEEIFEQYNVKFIQCQNQGTPTIFNNKKDITKPEDLKGMSVRTAGKWIGEAVKLWGGSPTTIPLPDLPTAVERNTVDAVYTGVTVYGPWKFYELTDYVTFTSLQENWAALIMNLDAWNKLSPNQQAAVEKAGEDYVAFMNEAIPKEKEELIKFVEDYGVHVTILTPEQTQAFRDAATSQLLEQVAETSGEGGRKLIEALKDIQ